MRRFFLLAGFAACSVAHATGELDLGARVLPVPQEARFSDPVALFGATDGYKKGGRISSNVHIPLRSQP